MKILNLCITHTQLFTKLCSLTMAKNENENDQRKREERIRLRMNNGDSCSTTSGTICFFFLFQTHTQTRCCTAVLCNIGVAIAKIWMPIIFINTNNALVVGERLERWGERERREKQTLGWEITGLWERRQRKQKRYTRDRHKANGGEGGEKMGER